MSVKYSRNAITRLNKMYKSVLVKCFILNCGMLLSISPANALYGSLSEAVADTTTPREYVLTDDEDVSAGLGTMGGNGAILTIDGSANKYGINADNVTGITVGNGNTLILKNLGSVTINGEGKIVDDYVVNSSVNGFNIVGYGGFLKNAGTLTIKDSVFNNNKAQDGGAIYNNGANANITEITNVTFYGNKVTSAGAAIYTSKNLSIVANGLIDDGVSTFQGNYYQISDGEKKYEAIYVGGASNTLTLDVKNGGVINMYDYINGSNGYKTNIIGDGMGTVNLYNDIRNSNVSVGNAIVNIENQQIETGSIAFTLSSTLNLAINGLTDHGKVTANQITVDNGAKLNVTLAQGIVRPGQKAVVQLLKADNTEFNNFSDNFDNNMYHFQKVDKNGAYSISMEKSAEDISREAGGSKTEIEAAKAWVDSANFAVGTKAAEVAEKLSKLAQNDAKAFNKALSNIAPSAMPSSLTIMTSLTDRLLLTVDSHLLSKKEDGLASGESNMTMNGITVWTKVYQGKS